MYNIYIKETCIYSNSILKLYSYETNMLFPERINMKKKVLIPVFLTAVALPLALASAQSPKAAFAEMFGEANSKSAYIQYAKEVGAQLANEGFVLLKNDGFLPMNTQDAKISLAGKATNDLLRGGTGSGAGSIDNDVKPYAFDLHSSLEAVGCVINPTLKNFYNNSTKSGRGRTNGNTGWTGVSQVTIGETPLSSYSADELSSMDEYGDAIFQVITREGSEGCDLKTCDCRDNDSASFTEKHALELSDNEQALFDELHNHTDHIIMIINSSNVFECGQFEDDPKVSAIIWIGNPGDVGPGALGRIVSGEINPSGRTVDTWARDFTEDPTWQNFSDNAQTNLTTDANGNPKFAAQNTMFNADGTPVMSYGSDKSYTDHSKPNWADEFNQVVKGGLNGVKPGSYVSYEEGIYYDYRYYETKYDDMKAGGLNADEWYKGDTGVVYPFGYGLSYTSFEQEIVSTNLPSEPLSNPDTKVEVKVKVTNTGSVEGKEVVQLYFRAPYFKGGIEKASKVLCAFAKTDLLGSGESQELTLEFYLQDVANYDFKDSNNNGFVGYELDGGDYEIVLGKNAHEEWGKAEFKVQARGLQYAVDRYTGNPVINRFTDRGFYNCLPGEDDFEFTQMSRENFDETFPTHPTIDDRTLGENSRAEEFLTHEFSLYDLDGPDSQFEYMPEAAHKTKEDIEELGWTQAADTNGTVSIKVTDLLNTDMDDPIWDEFMNQMTFAEMLQFVSGGGNHNPAINRFGKQATGDSDGPQRFKVMWWVSGPITAATFNVELARLQGDCIGMEGRIQGTQGWAGPGVNIHRSPFGGRNFEYYSADPFLTGRMAGRVVAGVSDRGVYSYFKHFAVNDQEKEREGVSAFLTEQALREIYLKAFQLPIQEGKSLGIMSSYNRLGLMETAASYPLLTEVLREEWGFKGSIISDMTHHSNSAHNNKCYENINNRILAGCNQQLDNQSFSGDMNASWDAELGCPTFKHEGDTIESYSWWYAVRKMAQQCIWMNCRSSKYVSSFIAPLEGMKVSGVNQMGQYVVRAGEDIDITISLPDDIKVGGTYDGKSISAINVKIDDFTALPEGLTFANNKITGNLDTPVNKFIHVLVELTLDGSTTKVGTSFELIVLANSPEVEVIEPDVPTPVNPDGNKGCAGGCGGSIAGTAALIGLAGILGIALSFKKRKED